MQTNAIRMNGFLRQLHKEIAWLCYSKILYLLLAVWVLLSLMYASHAVTNWNSAVVLWNARFGDAISLADIREALSDPTDGYQKLEGGRLLLDNAVKVEAIALLKAYVANGYGAAVIGGLSVLTFFNLPVIAFLLGMCVGSREYKSGFLLVKADIASRATEWGAKAIALCGTVLGFMLVLSLFLPISVGMFGMFMGESVSAVKPAGLFEIVTVESSQVTVLGTVAVFGCVAFILCAFALAGSLVGEIAKERNGLFMALFVALYFVIPLGNFMDPRVIFTSLGKDIFWLGTSFNPYLTVGDDLVSPATAFVTLLVAAILCLALAVFIRSMRISSMNFLRRHE